MDSQRFRLNFDFLSREYQEHSSCSAPSYISNCAKFHDLCFFQQVAILRCAAIAVVTMTAAILEGLGFLFLSFCLKRGASGVSSLLLALHFSFLHITSHHVGIVTVVVFETMRRSIRYCTNWFGVSINLIIDYNDASIRVLFLCYRLLALLGASRRKAESISYLVVAILSSMRTGPYLFISCSGEENATILYVFNDLKREIYRAVVSWLFWASVFDLQHK